MSLNKLDYLSCSLSLSLHCQPSLIDRQFTKQQFLLDYSLEKFKSERRLQINNWIRKVDDCQEYNTKNIQCYTYLNILQNDEIFNELVFVFRVLS